mmetsp:Transcript_128880/g.411999  ORF Transcript_128880/g.411999 Transcript_128880/m.411999 type:complete len:220 (+) Transcript_128880:1088-1747(+)
MALCVGVGRFAAVQAVVQRQLREVAADDVDHEEQQDDGGQQRLHASHQGNDQSPKLLQIAQQAHHAHDSHQPQNPQHAHQRQRHWKRRPRLPQECSERFLQNLQRDHNEVEDVPPSARHREEDFAEGDDPQCKLRDEERREDSLGIPKRDRGNLLCVPCTVVGLYANGQSIRHDEDHRSVVKPLVAHKLQDQRPPHAGNPARAYEMPDFSAVQDPELAN